MTLDELGVYHGTDKASTYCGHAGHNYTRIYEHLFDPLRDEPITLLELGWGGHMDNEHGHVVNNPDGTVDYSNPDLGGASARMWRDYFSKAAINVIDIHPKTNTVDGVSLFCGAQDDPAFLSYVHAQTGDYDIIIDDASHISSKTIRSHKILWPALKPAGYYIIEDLHASYTPSYYGDSEADEHPDTLKPTIMNYLKTLADQVNSDFYSQDYRLSFDIASIHFHRDLCVLQKATP